MRKNRLLAAVMLVSALVAAACGSSSTKATGTTTAAAGTTAAGSAKTTAGAAGDGLAALKAKVDKYSKPETAIGVTIPLKSKPAKKTIAWLECDVPTCKAYLTPGFTAATTALGWTLKIIPMKSTEPGPAFQQAIDAKVDYIASTGLSIAQYQPQLDAANKAGIKVLSCFGTDDPSPTTIQMQCGDESFVQKTGPVMADWAIVKSNGAANILIVSIPDFPILKVETTEVIKEIKASCAKCTYDELNVTLDDLIGGKVPAAIVSKLQANSKLNYVFYSFGDLPGGVSAALGTAGLAKQVTQFGQDFSTIDLDEIIAGTMGAWSADPKGYAGWLMVDAAARLSIGMTLDEERAAAALPTLIVDNAALATAIKATNGDWAPPGADAAFKKLWGV
jgi:ABC-type sugar transport system substrate-binding protein